LHVKLRYPAAQRMQHDAEILQQCSVFIPFIINITSSYVFICRLVLLESKQQYSQGCNPPNVPYLSERQEHLSIATERAEDRRRVKCGRDSQAVKKPRNATVQQCKSRTFPSAVNVETPHNEARRDHYGRDQYGRDQHGRDHYGRDQYGRDHYGRDQYDRDQYGRDQYGRDHYDRDQYGRDHYGRDHYDRDHYGRDQYGRDQ
ncbi:uncharacterized secreted protein ARB_06108-like, partial [Penaeus japonicus]|uniref:uncharacterized secreted protein ARB_06108-like n=1 Tax=Penaeus japonicus TaxID=27405 RepID=UPI001C70F1F0